MVGQLYAEGFNAGRLGPGISQGIGSLGKYNGQHEFVLCFNNGESGKGKSTYISANERKT